MKTILLFSASVLMMACTGCLGPRKVDKWVDEHYAGSADSRIRTKNDYLTINSNIPDSNLKTSVTTSETKKLLPLLLYWQYDYNNNCTLRPKMTVNTVSSTLLSYAGSKSLKQKLSGQKIEMTIEKVPTAFSLRDEGHIIFLLLWAVTWERVTFEPENQEMVVSYKILRDNQEVKKGTVTISNTDKILKLKSFQSLKKATGQYLDQYEENMKLMSKMVIDRVITEHLN
jgi:hypothetical protein